MKIGNPQITLRVPLESQHRPGYTHAVGSMGIAVEHLGGDVMLIEIRVPDETLVGGAWYETFDVRSHEIALTGHQVMACAACGAKVPVASPEPTDEPPLSISFRSFGPGETPVIEAEVYVCGVDCATKLRERMREAGSSFEPDT